MENTIAYFGLKDEDDYMYKKGEAKTEARFQKELAAKKKQKPNANGTKHKSGLNKPNVSP